MDHELRYPLTELTEGSLLRLCNAQGRAIVVFEGRVWITQEDDLRDIVVDSGGSFSVDRPGLTLVQALGPSRLMVLDPGATPTWPEGVPGAYELQQRARLERSVAIGRALATVFAALRRLLALPSPAAAMRPRAQPLRPCVAGR